MTQTQHYSAEQVAAARRKVESAMVDSFISSINAHMDEADKTLVAFTPLVVQQLAWHYADNAKFSAVYPVQCSETKQLSRQLSTVRDKYDRFMRGTLDVAHLQRVQLRCEQTLEQFAWHFQQLELAVRNAVLKIYADRIETRCNARLALCMISLLDELTKQADARIMQRTATSGYSVKNPWIIAMAKLMQGYVGELPIATDFNMQIGICVLLQDVKTIKYLDDDEQTLQA